MWFIRSIASSLECLRNKWRPVSRSVYLPWMPGNSVPLAPGPTSLFQILNLYGVSLVYLNFQQVDWSPSTGSFLLATVTITYGDSRPRVGKWKQNMKNVHYVREVVNRSMYLLCVACSLTCPRRLPNDGGDNQNDPFLYILGCEGQQWATLTSWICHHSWWNSLHNATSLRRHSHDDIIVSVITVTLMTPPPLHHHIFESPLIQGWWKKERGGFVLKVDYE